MAAIALSCFTGTWLFLVFISCTAAALCWENSFFARWWLQWPPAAPLAWLPSPYLPAWCFLFPRLRFSLQCTPSCGPGYRHRVVLCKSGESGDTLPESKCPKQGRPTSRVRCNLQRCPPPQWVTGPWGEVKHQTLWLLVFVFLFYFIYYICFFAVGDLASVIITSLAFWES